MLVQIGTRTVSRKCVTEPTREEQQRYRNQEQEWYSNQERGTKNKNRTGTKNEWYRKKEQDWKQERCSMPKGILVYIERIGFNFSGI